MEHWKSTILKGNSCFNRGDLVDARELYLQALALAQVLLERWGDPDEAVAAFVISHHNLADLHLSLKQRTTFPSRNLQLSARAGVCKPMLMFSLKSTEPKLINFAKKSKTSCLKMIHSMTTYSTSVTSSVTKPKLRNVLSPFATQ